MGPALKLYAAALARLAVRHPEPLQPRNGGYHAQPETRVGCAASSVPALEFVQELGKIFR